MFVYRRPSFPGMPPKTRADEKFCRNWTAHRRNALLKEFGPVLAPTVLYLARCLPTVKRWQKFSLDKHCQRSPKKLLSAYPRDYRGKLKKLSADIRDLDPHVWHKGRNMKKRHELAFVYGRFLTKKQVERLLACPEHPRSKRRSP